VRTLGNSMTEQIYQRAAEVMESPEAVRLWLETPNYGLGIRRPIDLIDSGEGGQVLDLLGRIQHGVFS
jgi:putative toxin-antitoxin system antitoxin component (TIGR02293 family)